MQTSSTFKLNEHQKRKHPTLGTNQRGGGQYDLLTNHLFQDAQPSGSRQPQLQQQQQREDKEFEVFLVTIQSHFNMFLISMYVQHVSNQHAQC